MNLRSLSVLALVCAIVCCPAFAKAQEFAFVSDDEANKAGLVREWFAQVELDRSSGGVGYLTQYVSQSQGYTVFDVESPRVHKIISEHDLDRFGDPLTVTGAKRTADDLVAKLRETEAKAKVKLTTRRVPDVTLFASTDRGTVHAIDGMSGRTRWTTMNGNPNYPTTAVGANDRFAAVANGSTMYVLDVKDGKLQWKRRLGGSPGAGPALADTMCFIPMVNGVLETHNLEKPDQPTFFYQSHGRTLIQPTVSKDSVAWCTDKGHIYVARANDSGLRFRLETSDRGAAPVTYVLPHFFATSAEGYAYCLHELSGDVVWRFSTGEVMLEQPVVVNDRVYLVTRSHALFCLNAKNGEQLWTTGGVSKVLSCSSNRVHVLASSGRLVSYDVHSGAAMSSLGLKGMDFFFTNLETDRIYIGTRFGVIQCLRQTDLNFPQVHLRGKRPAEVAVNAEPKAAPADRAEPKPAAPKAADEVAPDPFGAVEPATPKASPKPANDADDPFAK